MRLSYSIRRLGFSGSLPKSKSMERPFVQLLDKPSGSEDALEQVNREQDEDDDDQNRDDAHGSPLVGNECFAVHPQGR